jgi:hypothetical protein
MSTQHANRFVEQAMRNRPADVGVLAECGGRLVGLGRSPAGTATTLKLIFDGSVLPLHPDGLVALLHKPVSHRRRRR